MTNKELIESYKKGLELATKEIGLHKEYYAKHGENLSKYSTKIIATQEENAQWYREEIARLEKQIAEENQPFSTMKKEFSKDQLALIRDTFGDMCEKSIERGNINNAQEELDIINVIQNKCGYDEYENLDQFYKNDSGDWAEIEEREVLEPEAEAVKLMIDYAKSEETKPSETLKKAVNVYLADSHVNNGRTREDSVEYRKIAIAGLIIGCIYKCDHYELKKLDRVKELLAENF